MAGEQRPQTPDLPQPPPEIIKQFEQALKQQAPDVLKSVPQDKRTRLIAATLQVSQTFMLHQGPLPDPATLEGYNRIITDGANRIMKMAEDQAAHRMELEKRVINSQQIQSERGQWLGLAIAIVGLGVALVLGLYGQQVVASVVGGGTVVSLAVAFITGRHTQKKELLQKRPPA